MARTDPADMQPSSASRYLAAALVALPVGAILWFEIVYLLFGFTGEDIVPPANIAATLVAFGTAFAWSLRGALRPALVVQRGCGLGIMVSLMLPVVSFAVLLLWQAAPPRKDLGMGGLMFYALPVVALGAACILALMFFGVGLLARRRLAASAPPAPSGTAS